MDEDRSTREQAPTSEEELPLSIPMTKTSPLTWVGLAAGGLVVGGLAAYAWAGGSGPAAEQAQPERAAAGDQASSAKEMRDHLLTTQKAFAAGEGEGEGEAASSAPTETGPTAADGAAADGTAADGTEAKGEASEPAPASRSAAASEPSKTSPSPQRPQQQPKQKLDSLDSLGADITSALK